MSKLCEWNMSKIFDLNTKSSSGIVNFSLWVMKFYQKICHDQFSVYESFEIVNFLWRLNVPGANKDKILLINRYERFLIERSVVECLNYFISQLDFSTKQKPKESTPQVLKFTSTWFLLNFDRSWEKCFHQEMFKSSSGVWIFFQ